MVGRTRWRLVWIIPCNGRAPRPFTSPFSDVELKALIGTVRFLRCKSYLLSLENNFGLNGATPTAFQHPHLLPFCLASRLSVLIKFLYTVHLIDRTKMY